MTLFKAKETKSLSHELHEFSRIGFLKIRARSRNSRQMGLKTLVPW